MADQLSCVFVAGEVSDSDSKMSDNNFDSAQEEFDDGLDENLIRDDEDRKRLEQMTEKEREQELFNRIEKRELMRTRYREFYFTYLANNYRIYSRISRSHV